MEELRQMMKDHIAQDERLFESIEGTLTKIRENHLEHIQKSVTEMEANISWLRWGLLAILGGIIATYFKH